MPHGKQHLYRTAHAAGSPAIMRLNIQNIRTTAVLIQHDCIRTVRRRCGWIMPLYMTRTHFQWIGRRMTERSSQDARPFNDRVVHGQKFHYLPIRPWLSTLSPKEERPHPGQLQTGAGASPSRAGTSAFPVTPDPFGRWILLTSDNLCSGRHWQAIADN